MSRPLWRVCLRCGQGKEGTDHSVKDLGRSPNTDGSGCRSTHELEPVERLDETRRRHLMDKLSLRAEYFVLYEVGMNALERGHLDAVATAVQEEARILKTQADVIVELRGDPMTKPLH